MKTLKLSINMAIMMLAISSSTLMAQAVIEEITVTARNRAENLQDVPISITAFTAEQLDKMDIQNVDDLCSRTRLSFLYSSGIHQSGGVAT